METLYEIISKESYLIGLISALIIGGILKQENYFIYFYHWISSKLKNKKASLVVISALGGIFPIEGRCTVSAPFIDSICKGERRSKMGILDYIATHHYYLWSPLEPSVLIFMSVLGLSWITFMQATIIPLIIYLLFLTGILVWYIDEKDVTISLPDIPVNKTHSTIVGVLILVGLGLMIWKPKTFPFYVTFPAIATVLAIMSKTNITRLWSFINWKLIIGIGIIIGLGTFAKTYNDQFTEYLKVSNFTIPVLILIGMVMAFIMGSSSKYAGIGALIVSITSIKLLPIILITEFSGYLISPTHKCLGISKMYFGTKLSEMLLLLFGLIILLLLSAMGTYYLSV